MDGTLDELGDRVDPRQVYRRRKEGAARRMRRWKDQIMGSSDYDENSGEGRLRQAADTVAEAPTAIARGTRGNPLAAGLVAFGVGLVAGTALPQTEIERRAYRDMEPQVRRAAEDAKEAASHAGEAVKETAQQEMEALKESAAESAEHVREEAQGSAKRVRDETKLSSDRIQE